jgi:hypothetical protein
MGNAFAFAFPGASGHGPTHVCTACAARHHHADFLRLALVERLDAGQLDELITCWPWRADAALELRRCSCGATLGWLDETRAQERSRSSAAR